MACPNCLSELLATRFKQNETVTLLFKDNEPATDAEAVHVLKSLTEARSSLANVETQIEGLEKLLEELRQERAVIERAIDQHNTVLSPLRSLSTEILTEILLRVLCPQSDASDSLNMKTGSWPLSQVCHRWREVVVSHSQFWSSIYIRQYSRFDPPDHALSMIKAILCRSGVAPLDIIFILSSPGDIAKWRPMLDLLASASLRWKTLDWRGGCDLARYLDPIRDPVPQLEELKFEIRRAFRNEEQIQELPVDVWYNAPRLRRVVCSWNKYGATPRSLPLQLSWSRITHFDIGLVNQEFLSVIGRLTNLTHLTLCGDDRNPLALTRGTIRLNHLRQLHLTGCTYLLEDFTLPVLDDLTIANVSCVDLVRHLSQLLTRSECKLTRFALALYSPEKPVDDSGALALYHLVPSVVELGLELFPPGWTENKTRLMYSSLITQLKYDHDGVPLLPNLEILHIYMATPSFPVHSSSFHEAIMSRTLETIGDPPTITPLRSLNFQFGWSRSERMITLNNLELLLTMNTVDLARIKGLERDGGNNSEIK